MSERVLRAENDPFDANCTQPIESLSNSRKAMSVGTGMLLLNTVHHTEKMFLLNILEACMAELMCLHQEPVGQLNIQGNRVTTAQWRKTRLTDSR